MFEPNSPSAAEQELRSEVARFLPLVTAADRYYISRGRFVDPTPWVEPMEEGESGEVADRLWRLFLHREISQLTQTLYGGELDPERDGKVDLLEFSNELTEYSRRVNRVLDEWHRTFPAFRVVEDYVYWVQPQP